MYILFGLGLFHFHFFALEEPMNGLLGDTIPEDAHMIFFRLYPRHLEIGVDLLPCSCKMLFNRHPGALDFPYPY